MGYKMHPGVAMILVQLVFGGIPVFYKLAINDGMSMRVLVTYRLIFGAASLAPVAFVVERGALYHNLYLASIKLTSPTFAAALYNLNPVFTYIVALFVRWLETFSLKTLPGIAKVAGTATCITGAMLLTFFKGFEINIWHSKIDLLHHNHKVPQNVHSGMSGHQAVLGLGISLIACLSYSLWIILQAKMSENYPCFYSSTFLMTFTGSVQSVIYALCFDREWDQWKLGWNIRLLYVVYLGILSSGLTVVLMAWCIAKRGPLFVSVFNPLMLLVTAVASSVVLQENLHLGSNHNGNANNGANGNNSSASNIESSLNIIDNGLDGDSGNNDDDSNVIGDMMLTVLVM
ncbi:hypothetical protein JRO89_XS08G0054800 [Xanthoceras sorbifolium]|uniref:WAT1-related protein n=1 Tax=Xanthoceras sorbifolium TaxID=99658 RepID=A0ABQ8HNU7_9ROSI|nr:hypothetical protein JRO89_XS08G0054800 [Xanthoceras sorbifolium]